MTCYLVCGGRDFSDYDRLAKALADRPVTAIVHGNARGADKMAGAWARAHGIPEIKIDPNWDYYGKAAGMKRNSWMLEYTKGRNRGENGYLTGLAGHRNAPAKAADISRQPRITVIIGHPKDPRSNTVALVSRLTFS